jgi:hypothetical protein
MLDTEVPKHWEKSLSIKHRALHILISSVLLVITFFFLWLSRRFKNEIQETKFGLENTITFLVKNIPLYLCCISLQFFCKSNYSKIVYLKILLTCLRYFVSYCSNSHPYCPPIKNCNKFQNAKRYKTMIFPTVYLKPWN